MGALQGVVVLQAGEEGALFGALQTVLPEQVDHIAPEARHPLVQPEAENILDLLQDGGVVVIEVRLPLIEEVEVVLAPLGVELPAVPAEKAGPVVGQ